MKKLISAALAMALSLSFAACGKEEAEPQMEVTAPMLTEAVVPMLTEAPTTAPTTPPTMPTLAIPEETLAVETVEETLASAPEESAPPALETLPPQENTSSQDLSGIAGVEGTISGTYKVNVRKQPSVKSEKVTELKQGEKVTVYEVLEQDNAMWAHTNAGWIAKQYVKLSGPLPEPDPKLGVHGEIYFTQKVNIREEPSVSSKKVTELTRGTMVTVYETKNNLGKNWGRIDEGWVSMDYVKLPAGKVPPVAGETNKTVG